MQSTNEMCEVQIYFELLVVIFSSSHNITSWWEKAWTPLRTNWWLSNPKLQNAKILTHMLGRAPTEKNN